MDAQAKLSELQHNHQLSILTLSEPYLIAQDAANETSRQRSSNGSSNTGHDNASPAILAADLAHYQELFSKLRFSYVEQVTKERFLRAITADQPEFVDAGENIELEQKLKEDKFALKEKKQEVRDIVKELEEQGRHLAARYENVQLQTTQLETLPAEIENLESAITALRESQCPKSDNPALAMPLQPTLELLEEREAQLQSIERQIESLRAALPHKQAQVSALQDEVSILNTRKIRAVEEAKDARRRREVGGMEDELEERGRWLRSVEAGLRTMLEV
jgi:chromosome segregation ATPase